ncbi:HlyD family type I secretion periplasmic adaptor subunit [Rhizobiales bacterium]|uniref:HlyD family type I secretion periplasmic adaptor subunit n=1 Tax=Hongsoonwoonella zoysiae TaxID=2821844 RepID=UPI0015618DD5|nr:HlyD family type I secretion periplasmic adaptor subunit [Hongsoonwoonella zoysiae]NRG16624.1 HlyD family type I secretion periplasmic adaptor subunit [Hongsoonwoonella zoysiae]
MSERRVITSTSAALMAPPRFAARAMLIAVCVVLSGFLAWAWSAELDQIVFAEGRVIPSGEVQTVQNLEGGIVEEILVRAGDRVKTGDVLLQIAGTSLTAELNGTRQKLYELRAEIARLTAEIEDVSPVFPQELIEERPDAVERAMTLYESRQKQLADNLAAVDEQLARRDEELETLHARSRLMVEDRELLEKEVALVELLVSQGAVSEVEVLRLKRELNQLDAERKKNETAIATTGALLAQGKQQRGEIINQFRTEAIERRNELNTEAEGLSEALVASTDRVSRTAMRAPVSGIVKQVLVNTVGGVIQPGETLVEIVPEEDTLVVEAQIKPEDIAFLWIGQPANLRLTAYDFAIYGSLSGELEYLSADTVSDDEGRRFYIGRIRTDDTKLPHAEEELPILPGMVAQVDLVTGKRSVLDYLLKPVNRARQRALRER